jgi:hypothetical protein
MCVQKVNERCTGTRCELPSRVPVAFAFLHPPTVHFRSDNRSRHADGQDRERRVCVLTIAMFDPFRSVFPKGFATIPSSVT